MWLYVAGKHEVHFGVENFRTNTEAGPRRTGFIFLPTEEQGEFLLQFYRDTELCQRLKMGAAGGDRQRLNRRVQSVLWSSKADAIKVAGFPRTITDRKGTFAKPAGW